jgi:hypothetical protein
MLCKAALPFVIIILAFMGKQYVLFGSFGTSQVYLAGNLPNRIKRPIPTEIEKYLMTSKAMPSFFFEDVLKQPKKYAAPTPPTGIPVLDNVNKLNGHRNMNYIGRLNLSKEITLGFLNVASAYPQGYLKSFRRTLKYFHSSLDDSLAMGHNRSVLKPLLPYYLPLCCGQTHLSSHGRTLIFLFPALILFASGLIYRRYKANRTAPIHYLPLVFITTTILYLTLVAIGISHGDFPRYRFSIDYFYLTLLGILLSSIVDVLVKWRRGITPLANE